MESIYAKETEVNMILENHRAARMCLFALRNFNRDLFYAVIACFARTPGTLTRATQKKRTKPKIAVVVSGSIKRL